MTYGKLKKRIYSLLDIAVETGARNGSIYDTVLVSVQDAVNSAARKISATLMCNVKRAEVSFIREGSVVYAELPGDFISLRAVYSGGKRYRAGDFDTVGNRAYCADMSCGRADVFYCAYPADVGMLDDGDSLEFDDFHCDILAYGAAMELCSEAYPGDYNKYVILATEYDERMANALIYGGKTDRVANSLYSKRRVL